MAVSLLLTLHRRYRKKATLKITVQEMQNEVVMKLEGRVIGPWVSECKRSWLRLKPMLSGRKLSLDLCGLTFIADAGMNALSEIYGDGHPTFIADSPLTRHFAEKIADFRTKTGEKGN